MKKQRLLEKVLQNPKDVNFNDMNTLLVTLGFNLKRVQGSHHIYKHPDIPRIINIQNKGGKVKHYQVNQFLDIVDEFGLNIKK